MNKIIFSFALIISLGMCALIWLSGITISWYTIMLAVAFSAFIGYAMRTPKQKKTKFVRQPPRSETTPFPPKPTGSKRYSIVGFRDIQGVERSTLYFTADDNDAAMAYGMAVSKCSYDKFEKAADLTELMEDSIEPHPNQHITLAVRRADEDYVQL